MIRDLKIVCEGRPAKAIKHKRPRCIAVIRFDDDHEERVRVLPQHAELSGTTKSQQVRYEQVWAVSPTGEPMIHTTAGAQLPAGYHGEEPDTDLRNMAELKCHLCGKGGWLDEELLLDTAQQLLEALEEDHTIELQQFLDWAAKVKHARQGS